VYEIWLGRGVIGSLALAVVTCIVLVLFIAAQLLGAIV
jgi:hypothetical protein